MFSFRVVNLTKDDDPGYKYSGCGIRFDARGSLLLSNGGEFATNAKIFSADISLSLDVNRWFRWYLSAWICENNRYLESTVDYH